ncbi:MAG: glycoside-pentoside-hexuronide (GPH):cation symporter [Treponema sp.]|nr:glycoside-pentoside-hexuronide (GPH):cation symporter [Treponema sp.]
MNGIKLSLKEKASYAAGGVGKDLIAMFIGGYYMFYLTQVQNLNSLFVGIAFFTAKAWDGINDPLMGMIVDNTRTKWGKYRPWIFTGAILNTIVNIAMFANINGIGAKYIYYTLIYILWGMTYTIMDIPYWSMIPSLSGTEKERNSISALARVSTSIGGLVVVGLVPMFLDNYFGKYSVKGYLTLSVFINIAYLILMILCSIGTKEKVSVPPEKIKFKNIFTTLLGNDQLKVYVVFIALIYTAFTLTTGFSVYFFAYDIKNFGLTGIFSIVSFGGFGLGMLLFPLVSGKFGAKKTFNASLVMVICGYILLFFSTMLFGKNLIRIEGGIGGLNIANSALVSFFIIAACGVLSFTGFGFVTVSATVMLADVVEYGEWKLKKRTDSLIFSMQSFMYKFAGASSALITGIGLFFTGLSGVDPETDTVKDINASGIVVMRIVMFLVPIVIAAVSMILYNKKYKIHGAYKEEMLNDLRNVHV